MELERKTWLSFVTAGSLLILLACGIQAQESKPSAPAAQRKMPAIPYGIVLQAKYVSSGKRDPFAPPAGEGTHKNVNALASAFPVESLRLAGTLIQGQKKWGFIMTPNGVIYRVVVGSLVGNRAAVVTEITERQVVLTETTADQKRTVTLTVTVTGN